MTTASTPPRRRNTHRTQTILGMCTKQNLKEKQFEVKLSKVCHANMTFSAYLSVHDTKATQDGFSHPWLLPGTTRVRAAHLPFAPPASTRWPEQYGLPDCPGRAARPAGGVRARHRHHRFPTTTCLTRDARKPVPPAPGLPVVRMARRPPGYSASTRT